MTQLHMVIVIILAVGPAGCINRVDVLRCPRAFDDIVNQGRGDRCATTHLCTG